MNATATAALQVKPNSFSSLDLNSLPEPEWGPIGKEVYERTYSRTKQNGERETWAETVWRVVDGNCSFVPERYIENKERKELFDLIYNFKLMPAGRHLWVTGVKSRPWINNCFAVLWWKDFSRHFALKFSLLMMGGGVGSNYSNKYIAHYAPFDTRVNIHFVCDPQHRDYQTIQYLLDANFTPEWQDNIAIADTREGWVDALDRVVKAAHSGQREVDIVFDVSQVRPYGSRIRGFGGTASGPRALMICLNNVATRLNNYLGTKPDWRLCMEIDHEIACCVVAGNVRRSARLAMKHWKDADIEDFINCKDDGISHWTANISVAVDNDFFHELKSSNSRAKKIMALISEGAYKNGEPGIYNISKASEGEPDEVWGTNPCGELVFSARVEEDPAYGAVEQCCLGQINLSAFIDDKTNLYKAARLMTRFLLRATFAEMPDSELAAIVRRNRRIGVGWFGFQEWLVMQGIKYSECWHNESVKKTLRKLYEVIRKEARDYAYQMRIPEPIKTTAIAPTGTVAKMPGTSEGIHPIFARYFIRRVLFSESSEHGREKIRDFEQKGFPVEDSVYTPNTKVVSFYVKDPLVEKVENAGIPASIVEQANEIHLDDLLAVQAMVQECFADNSISFTANFNSDNCSPENIAAALSAYGPSVKGATVMPDISNRPQMPYERISQQEWESFANRTVGQAEIECKNGACPIK